MMCIMVNAEYVSILFVLISFISPWWRNSLEEQSDSNKNIKSKESSFASPRREKRKRSMRAAMDIDTAKQRQLVIGRPSWPMDRSDGTCTTEFTFQ